jgi:glutathione S-transferase
VRDATRVDRHPGLYKLFVIPGSHACRSAMLVLEHKHVPYKRVDIPTLTHPVVSRLNGFTAGGQTRVVGSRRPVSVRFGDLFGTVPALAAGRERISTNHAIARFLDERHPDPPSFPSDPDRRRAVEEAEAWGNEVFQMAARRIVLGVTLRADWPEQARAAGNGRMGHLLYRHETLRRWVIPFIAGQVFNVNERTEPRLLDELPGMLDRIDAWIAEGVLDGDELNAADFMIAPSLALILYRPDMDAVLAGRPALHLADRLLPAPASAEMASSAP